MKKYTSTVVEITDTHVKFLQMRSRGAVSACEARPVLQHTDEEIFKIIPGLLKSYQKNINPEYFTLVIPRKFAILKQIRLPSHHDAEIKKMAGLQLVPQIPYPLEDVLYDYQVVDKDASGYSQLVVTVVHKEVCGRYLNFFSKAPVHPGRLVLSSQGLAEWISGQEQKKGKTPADPAMVINVDTAQSEVCFCQQRKIFFSRGINFGARDLGGDHFSEFIQQISLSLDTYNKGGLGPDVKKIWLVSSLPEIQLLQEKLAQELKLPIDALTSMEGAVVQKNVALSASRYPEGISWAVDLGLLQADPKKFMNFMPKEVHATKQTRLRKRRLATCFLLCILVCGLGFSAYGIEIYQKTKELNLLEQEREALTSEVKKAEQTIEFVNFFRGQFSRSIFIPDLVAELYALVPPEISFRSIEIDERGQLTLQGYAEVGSSVNDFQSRLVKSTVFSDVNLQFATKRQIFRMEVTDFKITAQLADAQGPEKP